MCTHKRYITNKYTGRRLLVNCGVCPACLQQKANRRAALIRSHCASAENALFVTLTYDRISCPYILDADLINKSAGDVIPVYREYRVTHSKNKINKRIFGQTRIGEIEYSGIGLNDEFCHHYRPIRHLAHRYHGGVCLYSDVQNFFKRFRQNLIRKYGISFPKIDYYCCSEYGSKTKRPHFHLLLFFPWEYDVEKVIRPAVIESWPFASKSRTDRGIEYFRSDPSQYVASYVNCFTSISVFLRENFPPKSSYSKFFGKDKNVSTLSAIMEMYERGNFAYLSKQKSPAGVATPCFLSKRDLSYYFPLYKGHSRLSDAENTFVISHPLDARDLFFRKCDYVVRECSDGKLDDDFKNTFNKISLGYRRFVADGGSCFQYDYAMLHTRIWNLYRASKLKYINNINDLLQVPLIERYDNMNDFYFGTITSDGVGFEKLDVNSLNPNAYKHLVKMTKQLEKYFWQKDKQRKVSNQILSAAGEYV